MDISLSNVNIEYLDTTESAIWGKNISFLPDIYYQVVAKSGKGKSSFVHLLFGLNQQYTGDIFYNQKKIKSLSQAEWASIRSNKMSIVFQDLKLFEDKTAIQNLLIKNELTHYYDKSKIEYFAQSLHVSHTLNRTIQTLSYGERQRIAIIRAMLQPFEVLLLDEPFSHLDEENINRCIQLIQDEVQKRKATIIHCDLEPRTYFSNAQM